MRDIDCQTIKETGVRLCKEATALLPDDVLQALQRARKREESPLAQKVLDQILRNAELARQEMLPLCQDTGTAVIFVEIGQDVHIAGGALMDALRDGVGTGYTE